MLDAGRSLLRRPIPQLPPHSGSGMMMNDDEWSMKAAALVTSGSFYETPANTNTDSSIIKLQRREALALQSLSSATTAPETAEDILRRRSSRT
jgi:hypothetical protein